MRHETATRISNTDTSIRNSDELLISLDDYIRLREIVGDHDLAEELDRAVVVPSDRMPENVVTMNSRLIYADENTGTRRELELVFPSEADPMQGRISVLAPVGCALLGLRVGQSIDWKLPSGHMHCLRVERVLHQPKGGSSNGETENPHASRARAHHA